MKFGAMMVFIVCFGLFLLDCGVHQIAGGDTSETGNTFIAGKVTLPSGEGMPRTQVMLIPAAYNPVSDGPIADSCIDTTDESGHYMFRIYNKEGKQYNLQAVQLLQRTRTLVFGITARSDTTFVHDAVLKNSGTIRVIFPDNAGFSNGYLYAPGTTIFKSLTDAGAQVSLDSVPAGILPEVCYSTRNVTAPSVLRYGVRVTSGDTAVVWNLGWNYSRTLTLNTTASGADVAGSVVNFPVLIRLTAANFDFTQAKNNGEDIRFTKQDNSVLSYEIERWDPMGKRAEIWVKVDTLFGNDSSQAITMYWGNPVATSASNGAAVFDTAAGFAGVWHLNENGDSVHDATADAFHGENSGSILAVGIIGNSRKFADGNYLKISGLLNSPSSVTLSAWVQSEKSTGGQDVISIGDAVMIRLDYLGVKGASGWFHNSPITSDDSKYAIDSSGRFLANTGWHYLTFSISATTHIQALYIDGEQCAVSNDLNPIYYAGLGADTYIGIHGNGKTTYNFGGQIDEVRVSGIAESPNWVKLCFMNQKAQDALVTW